MNRFKLNNHESKVEDYCRRKEQVQLLNVLDKCTQVLRDDRIWIRNRVKEGDQEIIQIFKKYVSKRPMDLASLQTNLRKHVMKIKDKCKKDQLQKFKENLNLGTNTFERVNYSNERSSKSIPYRKPDTKVMYFEDEDYHHQRNYKDRNYSDRDYRDEPRQQERTLNRYNPIARIKMTDPIQEEDYQLEQGISYRSKTAHNKNKTSEKPPVEYVNSYDDRLSLPWDKKTNNYGSKFDKSRKQFEYQKYQHEQEQPVEEEDDYEQRFECILSADNSNSKEQYEPPLPPRVKTQSSNLNQVSDFFIDRKPVSVTFSEINTNQEIKFQRYKLNLEIETPFYTPTVQPPTMSFSATPVNQQSFQPTDKPRNFSLEQSQTLNNSIMKSDYSKDEQSLFTSPELLLECRKFLQRSTQKLQSSSHKVFSLESSTYQAGSLENSMCQQSNQTFLERLTIGGKKNNINVIESFEMNNEKLQETKHQSSYNNHYNKYKLLPRSLQNQYAIQNSSPRIVDISQLYAEQVFEIIFPTINSQITFQKYSQIIYKRFFQTDKMIRLFKVADKNMSNRITASEFGKLLLSNCNYKPSPNPVKQIFTLIDIDRKGFFTLDDFEKFLEQVIDPQDEHAVSILEVCERLFELADVKREKRIDYWAFYLIRESKEYEEFSIFLEQFEFELEL